jgi:hypothetical protein
MRLTRNCPGAFHDAKIQDTFLRIWTSLLRNYRQFLVPEPDKAPSLDAFRKQEFLAQFTDRETRLFMTHVCDTQAFAQFITDRLERDSNDHEILFFDEAIKAKLNRSKIRMAKETTPFLDVFFRWKLMISGCGVWDQHNGGMHGAEYGWRRRILRASDDHSDFSRSEVAVSAKAIRTACYGKRIVTTTRSHECHYKAKSARKGCMLTSVED